MSQHRGVGHRFLGAALLADAGAHSRAAQRGECRGFGAPRVEGMLGLHAEESLAGGSGLIVCRQPLQRSRLPSAHTLDERAVEEDL